MFTGIIKHTGKISKIYIKNNNCIIEILSKIKFSKSEIGSSISCSGVCLTLKKYIGNFLKEALVRNLYIFESNRKLGKNGSKSMKRYMNLINKNKKNQERVNLFGDKLLKYRFNNV